MSSRALKRLHQEQLQKVVSDEEIEQEPEKNVKKFNPFDLLNDDQDPEQEEEEEEVEPVYQPVQKSKKKNKNKKKKKKNKQKVEEEQEEEDDDMSMKELDQVLKTLEPNPTLHRSVNNKLLSVNYRLLDAEAEMKRLFGSHIVNHERQQQSRTLKRSKFTRPKSEWPPYKRHGLSMECVDKQEYAFRHAEVYQEAQIEFLNAVAMHHPEALLFLTRKHPYHVDSLLQLSEIAKYSGDWTTAGDFIERALYAFERALHPQFSLGQSRLAYQRSENRPFFLAIFRHIQFLTRRGCWKTAFEFNKLLFSLDPESDPLGSLLSLDYHALASRDYGYLIQFATEWKTAGTQYPVDLLDMPNMAYSAAYAQFKLDPTMADPMLQRAIQKYPLVYGRLLQKLGEPVDDVTTELSDLMDIMQHVYVERTHSLWKEPEVLTWLKQNGAIALHQLMVQPTLACQQAEGVPLFICRHLVLMDVQSLLHYLPSQESMQMYDPFPPEDSVTQYDLHDRVRSSGTTADPQGVMGLLRQLLNGNGPIDPQQQERIEQAMAQLEQLRQQTAHQAPGAFPQSDEEDIEESHQEEDIFLEDEDLEIQRALAETFERR
ncbi:transcriptional repressor TCF25-domain-containing protein [Blakeslea trispora]|nr:transcriptional repressor TCF25-domain-containing protein [Blakeslea trispora]